VSSELKDSVSVSLSVFVSSFDSRSKSSTRIKFNGNSQKKEVFRGVPSKFDSLSVKG